MNTGIHDFKELNQKFMNTKKIHFPDGIKAFRVTKKWNARRYKTIDKWFKRIMVAMFITFCMYVLCMAFITLTS